MRPGEVLLNYQHLAERRRALEDEIGQLRTQLAVDEAGDRLRQELQSASAAAQADQERLDALDREVSAHRTRMRAHRTQLMSGRIRDPSDLTRMSSEVEHMQAALVAEEDSELELMQAAEASAAQVATLERELLEATRRREAQLPRLASRLQELEAQVEELAGEQERLWEQVPADFQSAYQRLARIPSPVAEVLSGECGGCHVALTAAELHHVRRGDDLVTCQNCSRILVAV